MSWFWCMTALTPSVADMILHRYVVARVIWTYMLSIAVTYFITLCLFPGLESEIKNATLGEWLPIIIMAIFNISDFVGKVCSFVNFTSVFLKSFQNVIMRLRVLRSWRPCRTSGTGRVFSSARVSEWSSSLCSSCACTPLRSPPSATRPGLASSPSSWAFLMATLAAFLWFMLRAKWHLSRGNWQVNPSLRILLRLNVASLEMRSLTLARVIFFYREHNDCVLHVWTNVGLRGRIRRIQFHRSGLKISLGDRLQLHPGLLAKKRQTASLPVINLIRWRSLPLCVATLQSP